MASLNRRSLMIGVGSLAPSQCCPGRAPPSAQGKPVWVVGLGVTDNHSGGRVGAATVFSIQSTSKNFTAAAIMVAVQRGLLDLDKLHYGPLHYRQHKTGRGPGVEVATQNLSCID